MTDAATHDFAQRIRVAIAAAGLDYGATAARMTCTPIASAGEVRRWATGEEVPSSSRLTALARATGASVEWLMTPAPVDVGMAPPLEERVGFERLRQNFTTTFCHDGGANMNLPEMSRILVGARDELQRLRFLSGEAKLPNDAVRHSLTMAVYNKATTMDGDEIGALLARHPIIESSASNAVQECALVMSVCRDVVDAVVDALWTPRSNYPPHDGE